MDIQGFDMEFEYRPGTQMGHVVALSRNPVVTNVRIISLCESDWFLALQMQDPKVQGIIEEFDSGK